MSPTCDYADSAVVSSNGKKCESCHLYQAPHVILLTQLQVQAMVSYVYTLVSSPTCDCADSAAGSSNGKLSMKCETLYLVDTEGERTQHKRGAFV